MTCWEAWLHVTHTHRELIKLDNDGFNGEDAGSGL